MSPYEQAWEVYHAFGTPGWSWAEVVGAHLKHGAVISTPDTFILARRVNHADPDHFHFSPLQWREDGDTWNIWCAAGRLESLVRLAESFPSEWVSYCRRDSIRLRRVRTATFLRHVLAIDPEASAVAASAGEFHRPGAIRGCA